MLFHNNSNSILASSIFLRIPEIHATNYPFPSSPIFLPKSFSDSLWRFLKISFSWTASTRSAIPSWNIVHYSERNEIGPWKISSEETSDSNDGKTNFNRWLKEYNIEKKIPNKSINAKPNFQTDKYYLSRAIIEQPVEIICRKTDHVIN